MRHPARNGSFEPKKWQGNRKLDPSGAPGAVLGAASCGNGQTLDIQSITWSNVVLTDTTYNDVFSFGSGTFTHTFFPLP